MQIEWMADDVQVLRSIEAIQVEHTYKCTLCICLERHVNRSIIHTPLPTQKKQKMLEAQCLLYPGPRGTLPPRGTYCGRQQARWTGVHTEL